MNKTEFIRWFRSIKNPVYMSDLKLSEVYDEIWNAAWAYGVPMMENKRDDVAQRQGTSNN